MALSVPTLLAPLLIKPSEIDHDLARGTTEGESAAKAESAMVLFKDRPLVVFLVCAVMFHFANAAMLPLLGEQLAKGRGRSSMLFMSACAVTVAIQVPDGIGAGIFGVVSVPRHRRPDAQRSAEGVSA